MSTIPHCNHRQTAICPTLRKAAALNEKLRMSAFLSLWGLWFVGFGNIVAAQPRPIDTSRSVVTIEVKKAGIFSAFAHDHQIAAPLAGGTVDIPGRMVELRFKSMLLQVRDRGISEKERADIQSTMLGAEVLDAQRYPEIVFRSTSVEPAGQGLWKVDGDLSVHGQTHPVSADVRDNSGHYTGSLLLRQSEFGITPIKIAGGTIRVKDEIRINFDIQLAR